MREAGVSLLSDRGSVLVLKELYDLSDAQMAVASPTRREAAASRSPTVRGRIGAPTGRPVRDGNKSAVAADALKFDIRWKVACGRSLTQVSFDPSALVYWRKRIAEPASPDRRKALQNANPASAPGVSACPLPGILAHQDHLRRQGSAHRAIRGIGSERRL